MKLVLSISIIFLAFLGQSLFGFGGGLIATPLLSLIYPVRDAVFVVLIFQLLMGFIILRTWQDTRWEAIKPLASGLLFGVLLGTASLAWVPDRYLQTIMVSFILVFLVRTHLLAHIRFERLKEPLWAIIMGFIGGVIQGAIGTAGPLLIMYLAEVITTKTEIRATIIAVLFFANVLRFLIGAPLGLMSPQVIETVSWTLPFFFLSLIFGQLLHKIVPDKVYQLAVSFILLLSTLSMFF